MWSRSPTSLSSFNAGASTTQTAICPMQVRGMGRRQSLTKWPSGCIFNSRRPTPKCRFFISFYQHDSSGVYQTETIDHHLLLDLRKGTPEIVTVMTCKAFEPIGGACSAQDEAWEGHDTIECPWDAAASDFHCTLTTPYGSPHAARTAQSEFYLLSSRPVEPVANHPRAFADVGQLALRIRDNQRRKQTTPLFRMFIPSGFPRLHWVRRLFLSASKT